jgi:hypothetical protein
LEGAVEAAVEGIAAEYVEAAGVGEGVGCGGSGFEGAEGFGVGVDDVVAVDDEGCGAGRAGRVAGRDYEVGAVGFDGGDEPEEVGGAAGEGGREGGDGVADFAVFGDGDNEGAECAGAAGDAGFGVWRSVESG